VPLGGWLHELRASTVEWSRPGESELSGAALWRAGRIILTAVIVAINLTGVLAVLVISLAVVPLPVETHLHRLHVVTFPTAIGYIVLAVPIGALVGTRRLFELRHWLESGAPAGPRQRRLVLRAPLRLFTVQVLLWFAAAVLFGLLTGTTAPAHGAQFGITIGVTVAITGLVTAACAYLISERFLRAPAVRALGHATPDRLAVPGVATRSVLAWALGTGLPLLGLLALGIEALANQPGARSRLDVAVVVLGAVGLAVGLLAVTLAARATADPLDALRAALQDVQRGRLLAERERLREVLGTYVDPDVAEQIMREGTDVAGEEVEVTMMFVDVRNFTAFAENTDAPAVVAAINRLFEGIVPIIHAHGGRVDKFIGDGLLAVFGTPRRLPDHADRALAAALEIEGVVRSGRAGDLTIGIGLNSGVVVAGNVGGAGRLDFSVIGDPVNVAARVEAATRQTNDTVLLTERTKELLERPGVELVEREHVALKGKSTTVRLFAPARPRGNGG
jgi:adenylate cyclase